VSEFTVIMFKNNHRESHLKLWDTKEPHGLFKKNSHTVTIFKNGFYLSAGLTKRHNGDIYIEENNDPRNKSLVMSFGWCYRIGNKVNQLEEKDMIGFLQSHRSQTLPDVNRLSGIYSILSYDHLSETLWICTDIWAQHGFYYGSNEKMVVVSSKASIVANTLNANIDGISYLSLLRNTAIPPGRTLYCNVWRVTCGRGLYLDVKHGIARLVQMQPLYRHPEDISFKQAVDQFIDVVTKVCSFAASRPSTVVDLTGGNDSRLMAAALASAQGGEYGNKVTFKVVGDKDHPDVIIASKIANKFGWVLRRNDRELNQEYSNESLHEAAILSDGYHILSDILRRLTQESRYWNSFDGHVGSIGGELFRDFFWRHELQNMGRTTKVNFNALLKHRLYASNDIDVGLISDGKFTLNDHNLLLLSPYKMIDLKMPEIKNVYKLDLIYLHKLMNRSYCWILSDLHKLILPFLSYEITLVSLKTPWKFRVNRKLVTAALEKIQPDLSLIPTDSGAPMSPLRLSTLGSYFKYTASDLWSAYKCHFSKNRFKDSHVLLSVPAKWIDLIIQDKVVQNLYNTRSIINKINKHNDNNFSVAQYQEIQALILIQLLTQHYKGISPSLSFKGKDANFTEATYPL
jgi:hypothetical protein